MRARVLIMSFAAASIIASPLVTAPAAGASEGPAANAPAAGAPAAGAPAGFSATAEADGVRTTVIANGGPLTSVPVDTGSPVAQAALDSLGSSRAFASQAYPGDEAITLPGTVAGVSNGKATPPNYPLIAQSDASTQPTDNLAAPGSSLNASSSQSQSQASAVTGGQTGGSSAGLTSGRAEVSQATDGAVTAIGSNDAEAVTIGPLHLGRIQSSAMVRLPVAGPASKSSFLEVSAASVAGVAVSITPAGLSAGSSNIPLPASSPPLDALRNAGISVTYLAPEVVPAGIIAAGVKVTVSHDVPGPLSPVSVTYVFGQSAATIRGAAGVVSVAETAATAGAAGDAPSEPAGLPDSGAVGPLAPSADSALAHASSSGGSPAAASGPTAGRPRLALRSAGASDRGSSVGGFDLSGFYLVVAAAALVAAAMSRLVSLLGVKQWVS